MNIYNMEEIKAVGQISHDVCVNADCLDAMKYIKDKSIDMILCDLPYGRTACSWDTVIPFEPLWTQYKRIVKDNAAIVLFGSQPFTTDLIMSNRKWYRYEWIWEKNRGSNFANIRYMPFRQHENICVFYKNLPTYNPIREIRSEKSLIRDKTGTSRMKGGSHINKQTNMKKVPHALNRDGCKNPCSVIKFDVVQKHNELNSHPTQKPVDLLIYLIETYTNEGDLVLDNAAGSCSTAVACKRMGRKFIMIEQDADYCEIGRKRLKQELNMFENM